MADDACRASAGCTVTGGPTNAIFSAGLTVFIRSASCTSCCHPTVLVYRVTKSYWLAIAMVSSGVIPCGGASSKRLSGIMPAGEAGHTEYQNEGISRVAGHRGPAPPSNCGKEGGLNKSVFMALCSPYVPRPISLPSHWCPLAWMAKSDRARQGDAGL